MSASSRILVAIVIVGIASPTAAAPVRRSQAKFIRSIHEIMVALAPQNVKASLAIRQAYAPQLDMLMLDEYTDLEGALDSGRLAPLPTDPARFNFLPRLDGPNPIGEKDLARQRSYIAARPATLGLLLEVASQVKSGPIEITSLVRHGEYQESLSSTNANANTAVPMHTMGLAFDIALVNTPLKRIHEIRAVLTRMRDAGDLMFIGERRQLVFHVVPHPSRVAHFTDAYYRAVGVPSRVHGAHVIATAPGSRPTGTGKTPHVKTEVIAILPTDEFAAEWWVGETDDEVVVSNPAIEPPQTPTNAAIASVGIVSARMVTLFVSFVATLFGVRRQQSRRRNGNNGVLIAPV